MSDLARIVHEDKLIFANKDESFTWEAYANDGRTAVAFESGDAVVFSLGDTEDDATPILELTSGEAATANGSSISIDTLGSAGVTPASGVVTLGSGDLNLAGKKPWQICLIDSGDSNKVKVFGVGRLVFRKTM